MSDEKLGTLGLTEQELIAKLIQNRNSDGYFTIAGKADENEEAPDENLSKELRLLYAFEKFENSLEHKPEGKSVLGMVL